MFHPIFLENNSFEFFFQGLYWQSYTFGWLLRLLFAAQVGEKQ